MKFPRSSALVFTVVLVLMLSIESTFSVPFAATMFFLIQQPILTEEESIVLAGILGLLIAVLYHLPLAVGLGLFFFITLISRLTLSKPHLQTRDGLLTLLFCAILVVLTRMSLNVTSVVGLVAYFVLVNVCARIWISRRSFHARRSIK
jgi:hypothetical protein